MNCAVGLSRSRIPIVFWSPSLTNHFLASHYTRRGIPMFKKPGSVYVISTVCAGAKGRPARQLRRDSIDAFTVLVASWEDAVSNEVSTGRVSGWVKEATLPPPAYAGRTDFRA